MFFLFLLTVYVFAIEECDNNGEPAGWAHEVFDVTSIGTVLWQEGPQFLKQLIEGNEPKLILNSPVSQWSALNVWSDDSHLLSAFHDVNLDRSVLRGLTESSSVPARHTFFYSAPQAPLMALKASKLSRNFETVPSMTGAEFLAAAGLIQSSGDPDLSPPTLPVYVSKPLKNLSTVLWNDVQPLWRQHSADQEHEEEYAKLFVGQADGDGGGQWQPRTTLWMSSPGATARLHYDSSPNLFAQIRGNKNVMIVSPRYSHRLQPYSFAHPGHRQTAFDPTSQPPFDQDAFPLLLPSEGGRGRIPASVAQLGPGDALFIPAFHFHHIITGSQGPAMSVNTFLASPWKDLGQRAFQVPVPIDRSWVSEARVAGVVTLLRAAWNASKLATLSTTQQQQHDEVENVDDWWHLTDSNEVRRLFPERSSGPGKAKVAATSGDLYYSTPSLHAFSHLVLLSRWAHVSKVTELLSVPEWMMFMRSQQLEEMCQDDSSLTDSQKTAMINAGTSVGQLLSLVPERLHLRSMLFADYLERWTVIGGLDKQVAFLLSCFEEVV